MITSRVSLPQAETLLSKASILFHNRRVQMNGNVFVFRPGAPLPLAPNVFNDWHLLMSAMSGVEGRKILEFDDSVVTPCEIPTGTWPMKDVMWAGFGPRPGR